MISLFGNPIKRIGLGAIHNTGRIPLMQIDPVWGHGGRIRCLSTKIIPDKPSSTGQVDNINNDLDDVRNKLQKVQDKIEVLTDEWEKTGDKFSKRNLLALLKEDLATLNTLETNLIDQRNKLEVKLPPRPSPFTSFHAAFQKTINTAKWPSSVNAFLPQPFQPPPHSPYAVSAKNAKIMASIRDPTKPDMLLTRLDQDINFSSLIPINMNDKKNLGLKSEITIHSFQDLRQYGTILIIGAPGTGKTRLTIQMGWHKFVAFFVCNKKGNGGSSDMPDILNYAIDNINKGTDVIAKQVQDKIRQTYMFRSMLLDYCKNRYGEEKFEPRHWTMLQLFSKEIIGVDLFREFCGYNITDLDFGLVSLLDKFDCVVLDEAQVADNLLQETFPSLIQGDAYRSLLGPVARALHAINENSPIVVCGTKLSSSASSEIRHSIQKGTKTGVFGMSTFLDSSKVVKWLEDWGVNDAAAYEKDLEMMKGRPRPISYLAENLLCNADWTAVLDKTLIDACDTVRVESDKLEGRSVVFPHPLLKKKANTPDLLSYMRLLAMRCWVGRRAVLEHGTIFGVQFGFAGFDNYGKGITMREPIVVAALLTDVEGKEIAIDDETFQDYMVRHGKQVAEFVSSQAQSLGNIGEQFVGFEMRELPNLTYPLAVEAPLGEEATILEAMLSGKIKIPMMRTQDVFGPNLIRVFWKGDKPMVVFEQDEGGGAGTFEEAFKTLEHLQCKNLKDLKACIMKYKAVVVYLVVKPISNPDSPTYPCVVADPQFDGMNVLKVVISKCTCPEWMEKARNMLTLVKKKGDTDSNGGSRTVTSETH